MGELLPCLPSPCSLRRLQEVWLRARDPQDDAQPLQANQEHAHLLQPQQARLLLTGRVQFYEPSDPFWSLRVVLTAALAALLAPIWHNFCGCTLHACSFRRACERFSL